jgi:hypothetical protein
MKCDQATTWLLMSAGPSELPEPVARHLETCDSCRQLKRRLLQFNEQLSGFLPHAECQASRQRFLDGIDKLPARGALPVVPASTSTRRGAQNDKSIWMGKRLAALAAAMVIAFVGGWIVSGRYQSGRPLPEHAFQQPNAGAPSPSEPSQIVVRKTEPSRTFGRWLAQLTASTRHLACERFAMPRSPPAANFSGRSCWLWMTLIRGKFGRTAKRFESAYTTACLVAA